MMIPYPDEFMAGDFRNVMKYLPLPAGTAALKKKYFGLDMKTTTTILKGVLKRSLSGHSYTFMGPRWIGHFVLEIGRNTGWWDHSYWNARDIMHREVWSGGCHSCGNGATRKSYGLKIRFVKVIFVPRWNPIRSSQWNMIRLVLLRCGLDKWISRKIFQMCGGVSNTIAKLK